MLKQFRRNMKGSVLAFALGAILSVSLLGIAPTQAFAAEEATVHTDSSITLTAEQTDFSISLVIEHPNPFAGVETAVQCGAGVDITEVTYSVASSQAGPTDARGLTWFALFSGGNKLSGSVVATLHATYTGSENTSVVIDHSAFYTREGTAFETLNLPLRQEVVIKREGANNTPPPLEPPNNGNNNGNNNNSAGTPGSGNPRSGALVSYTPPTNSGGNGSSSSSDAAQANTDTNADTSDSSTLSSDQTPLSAADNANNIPSGDAQQSNVILSSLLFIALAAVAVLGFLLIAKSRKRRDEQQEER
jgi:hypothetical protein